MDPRELLTDLALHGVSVQAKDGALEIRPAGLLTNPMREALRECKPALLALLSSETNPYRLSATDADRCHAPCWTDAEITRFVARVSAFMRQGFSASDADDLAERLVLRDRQAGGNRTSTGGIAPACVGQLKPHRPADDRQPTPERRIP